MNKIIFALYLGLMVGWCWSKVGELMVVTPGQTFSWWLPFNMAGMLLLSYWLGYDDRKEEE